MGKKCNGKVTHKTKTASGLNINISVPNETRIV